MSASLPLVSIGMPVYNSGPRLKAALDSILAQDYDNFELFISDNCSTDDTSQICAEYAARNSRITSARRDRNYGISDNFDYAASRARGKYFMWVHDDDQWMPDFISTLVDELETHPEAGLAMCGIRRVREDGSTQDTLRFVGEDDPWQMSHRTLVNKVASGWENRKRYHLFMFSLFRTELVEAAQPYRLYDVPHPDRIFMCQFALAAKWRYVDRVLYMRTVHEQPHNIRLSEDQQNHMINHDKWAYAKTSLALGPYLMGSKIIPRRRKPLVPLAALSMARAYRHSLYRGQWPYPIKIYFGIYRRLKRVLKLALQR